MSMFQDNFTVLIQGPYNDISLNNIENYKKYGKISISCWDDLTGDQKNKLDSISANWLSIAPLPDIEKSHGVLKDSTFFYAVNSIYNALKGVDTKYVIKTRSDEYYKNLDCFIDEFMNDDDKIVCGNIFVRNGMPYHFGDHIFVCKTKDLLLAVENLVESYTTGKGLQEWMKQGTHAAETILCYSILNQKEKLSDDTPREIFLQNVSVVDVNNTGEFMCQWQSNNQIYKNHFHNHHGTNTTDDY